MKTTSTGFYRFAAMFAIAAVLAGCSKGSEGANGGGDSGQGGSMARFTINGDYLYTVDSENLNIVSLKDPAEPVEVDKIGVGRDIRGDIETIFTMSDKLFIGSRSGMFIYDISRPEFPKFRSESWHFTSCDPVVAYGNYAYVTLNTSSGWWCGNRGNVLQSYDITDIDAPELLDEFDLTSPRGLAVDGALNIVFVCDANGVKALDVTDANDIKGMYTSMSLTDVKKIDAYDCIAIDGNLIVTGNDGIYQLGYDRQGFTFKSKIGLR